MEFKLLIENFILDFGIIGSFILVFLEYANLPLPSEIVLPLIGIFASKYKVNLIILIMATTIGGVMGSLTNYFLGYKYGKPLIKKLVNKFPSLKKSIYTAQEYIEKYSKISLFILRMVPVARTAISIVAGVNRVNSKIFILYSTLGILIWNTLLISLGYIFAYNLDFVVMILSRYSLTCLFLFIISFGVFIYLRSINKKDKLS